MNYFFPSSIDKLNFQSKVLPELEITTNSGTNALRLLLRSFELPINSKVAIPIFACEAVKQAIETEKLCPFLLDLKPEKTFWTFYDYYEIKKQDIKVIILLHLYGFIHVDTKDIINFCVKNDIKLIHDAAQSYGVDERQISIGNGIIYSFGPGKSTTAAGGGWIKNVGGNLNYFNISKPTFFSFQNLRAKLFLKSRIYAKKLNKVEYFLYKTINRITVKNTTIFKMSSFQLDAASYVISNTEKNLPLRKKRYLVLKKSILNNSLLKIAYDDNNGLYFKLVLFINDNIDEFKKFLLINNVPYYCLFASPQKEGRYSFFEENAHKFIEISCESSIPETEIDRIANLLAMFR